MLLMLALAFVLLPAFATASRGASAPALVPTKAVGGSDQYTLSAGAGQPRAAPPPQPINGTLYDEQLGLSFTQSFTAMLYNVTAVAQSDPQSGTGPAYLLNGLTDKGYWYQVGLSWDWPGAQIDFAMNYEVFSPNGSSVDPVGGGGGIFYFDGPVNPGDTVALDLYLSSGQAVMLAKDYNTGAYALQSFSAEGASTFVGEGSSSNHNGFFTGLMTEWYHGAAYYGDEQQVTYSSGFALTSAWMWMDEFSCTNANCTSVSLLFYDQTNAPVPFTPPNQLVKFSSHGATEYADAFTFITGSAPTKPLVALTVSYSVVGGGASPPPILTYLQHGGWNDVGLTASPTTVYVDPGSRWNVTGVIGGSNPLVRWDTLQGTTGVAESNLTLVLVYYHQYLVNFTVVAAGWGPGNAEPDVSYPSFGSTDDTVANPGTGVWVDAGSNASFPGLLPGSNATERWVTDSPTVQVGSPGAVSDSYQHQYRVTMARGPAGGGNATTFNGWLDAGANVKLNETAEPGWKSEGWSGTGPGGFSGNSPLATFTLEGPANETAVFYPGLTIGVVGRGSVGYEDGSVQGSVSSGTETIYVPPGTAVTLTASTSLLYSFGGWGGPSLTGSASSEALRIAGPAAVTATFGYDYDLLAGGIAAATALLLVLAFALLRNRGPGPGAGPVQAQ